ncbi:Tc5 transposable domain DDE superfamily endonuclease-like protein, partial [Dinothrombium tinctorium]
MSKTTRRSFTVQFKLEAIKLLKENGGNINKTASELRISNATLRDWQSELFQWFKVERIDKKHIVNYRRLLAEAKSIANKKGFSNFIGSNKWVSGFLRRHKLSSRKITHIGQQDNRSPLEKKNIVENHLETVQLLCSDYASHEIFNMDETPVYIDMTSSTTISFTGEKNIEATHTGNTKTRFTVVLSVSAS